MAQWELGTSSVSFCPTCHMLDRYLHTKKTPIPEIDQLKNKPFKLYLKKDKLSIEDWWTSDFGGFITQTPADFNVQCLENTQLIHFTTESLEALYVEMPKLERFYRKVAERAIVASQKRIIQNFSLSAIERY